MNEQSIYFIIQGIGVTLKYSVSAVFFGFIIGIFLAILKISKHSCLKIFADSYTSIFRGTPLLIQLSIIYYAMPSLINVKLGMFSAGLITFSLNSGAYVSEIIRSGINSVDKGQFEAAKTLAIPNMLILKDIILPQAMRTILPALINELINLIKESAIISVIGEMDLMRRAQLVSLETYNYFIPMLIAACAYYILILLISIIAKMLERSLAR
jgi:polar amino acid transport system permease protein